MVSGFMPYSDFNFTSLYCWSVGSPAAISILNGNLVIQLPDYLTGVPIYSIIGTYEIATSARSLLATVPSLELVPTETVRELKASRQFKISPDRDNFDYIYSVKKLSTLPGKDYKGKRKSLSRFLSKYQKDLSLTPINFSKPGETKNLSHVFADWAAQRKKSPNEVEQESQAIRRLLNNASDFTLTGYRLSIGDRLVGFSINEKINQQYAICHFQKTILEYKDIDTYLSVENARLLHKAGCKYVNWEQDLGLTGLRDMKLSYKPTRFLKKYTVVLS